MEEPIKVGDLCEVIDGLLGKDSPNIGLIVEVHMYVGDEQTLGQIWRCKAEYGERIQPRAHIPLGFTDFAKSWLRKLPGEKPKQEQKEDTGELV